MQDGQAPCTRMHRRGPLPHSGRFVRTLRTPPAYGPGTLGVWCLQPSQFRAWRVQIDLGHVLCRAELRLGPADVVGRVWVAPCVFVSSDGHAEMKWGASSSCAPQSLQDGSPRPLLRELNLQASDSPCQWQPRRRRILKLDLVVRWNWSVQCVMLQRGEGVEKLGSHIVRYFRSPLTSTWLRSCRWTWVQGIFLMHLFQQLLGGGVFWINVVMLGKFVDLWF